MTRLTKAALVCGAALILGGAPAFADGHMDGRMSGQVSGKAGGKMSAPGAFAEADADGSGMVSRAEFLAHGSRHGMGAAAAEAAFARMAGGNRELSRDAFGGFDAAAMVRSGAQMRVEAGRYDADGDGRVSFGEYSRVARAEGLSSTQAAQRFVKMTRGRSDLSAAEFDAAAGMDAGLLDRPLVRSRVRGGAVGGNLATSEPERGFVFERDYTSTGEPRATVDRMHTPEDKRLGDLDSTPSPRMKVWGDAEPKGSLFGISD